MKSKELEWTGERLVTQVINQYGTIEHLHRYALAMDYCQNKIVLDIACGEGYGTNLLSSIAASVTGVDISADAVAHAESKYKKPNIKFAVGSTSSIPMESNSVDIVVSFETIEHHREHDEMMSEIKRVLKEDGILIISSPEKEIYSERDANNPFHLKELLFSEFDELIKNYFLFSKCFSQRYVTGSILSNIDESETGAFQFYSGNFDAIQKTLVWETFYNRPYFNLIICSNFSLDDRSANNASFFNGYSVYEEEVLAWKNLYLQEQALNKLLKESKIYRFGFFIGTPWRRIMTVIKKNK